MYGRIWIVALMVVGCATAAAAGDLFKKSKPRCHCFLPDYAYRSRGRSLPVSAVTGVALETTAFAAGRPLASDEAAETVRVKIYQLTQANLQKDHCQLSRVSVTLQEDGRWIVNFRAVQNPELVAEEQRPIAERFVRNKFQVAVRAHGAYTVAENVAESDLGKPEFYHLPVKDFWLERGQLEYVQQSGYSNDVRRYFDTIDRLEVDLRYE